MTESEMMSLMGATPNGIDAEKFGSFIAKRRRDKRLTQRELAEQLYISNKAVSKWERGLSLPDIALLEPLADALEVSVTELLHGECQQSEESLGESALTREESALLMGKLEKDAEENRSVLREIRKKRLFLYCFCVAASVIETGLLYFQGHRVDIFPEQVSLEVFLNVGLPLLFGIWVFFFIREKLPYYYDTEKISYYTDGIFRVGIAGVYFNNKNWPYIVKGLRAYCFLTPIFYPILYLVLRLLIPYEIWRWASLYVQLFVILGGLFLPVVILGKKYEV